MSRRLVFFRYLAYSLEVVLCLVLQGTPKLLPEFFGAKPVLLVALALSIGAIENKIPALIFGAVCGALTDLATGGTVGFFAITLTLVCYLEAHIFSTYFVPGLLPASIVSAIAVPAVLCLHFLFFTVFAGIEGFWVLFANHYISRIVQTFLATVLLYILNRFLCHEEPRFFSLK